MIFRALTLAQSLGKGWHPSPSGSGFEHLPQGFTYVNASKTMFDSYAVWIFFLTDSSPLEVHQFFLFTSTITATTLLQYIKRLKRDKIPLLNSQKLRQILYSESYRWVLNIFPSFSTTNFLPISDHLLDCPLEPLLDTLKGGLDKGILLYVRLCLKIFILRTFSLNWFAWKHGADIL